MDQQSACVCARLRRASRALTRHYDEALAPVALTVGQLSVLRTLSALDRPALADLAQATAHEKSALWRLIQPLVGQGWIAAEVEPGSRGQRLSVTPEGHGRLVEALPLWRAAQAWATRTLGPREDDLLSLLDELETQV